MSEEEDLVDDLVTLQAVAEKASRSRNDVLRGHRGPDPEILADLPRARRKAGPIEATVTIDYGGMREDGSRIYAVTKRVGAFTMKAAHVAFPVVDMKWRVGVQLNATRTAPDLVDGAFSRATYRANAEILLHMMTDHTCGYLIDPDGSMDMNVQTWPQWAARAAVTLAKRGISRLVL